MKKKRVILLILLSLSVAPAAGGGFAGSLGTTSGTPRSMHEGPGPPRARAAFGARERALEIIANPPSHQTTGYLLGGLGT